MNKRNYFNKWIAFFTVFASLCMIVTFFIMANNHENHYISESNISAETEGKIGDEERHKVGDEERHKEINKRAHYIFRTIKCAVCHGETIDESHTTFATNLRNIILKQIEEGKSDEEIFRYVETRFGNEISLRPTLNSATYLLWAFPAFVLLVLFYRILIRKIFKR